MHSIETFRPAKAAFFLKNGFNCINKRDSTRSKMTEQTKNPIQTVAAMLAASTTGLIPVVLPGSEVKVSWALPGSLSAELYPADNAFKRVGLERQDAEHPHIDPRRVSSTCK